MSDHLHRLQFAAPSTSPGVEHLRPGGLRPRFVLRFSTHFLVSCLCDVTSAKPMTEPDCVSASGQAQIRPCTTRPNHHAATAVRLSEVDASGDALSAPITVNNNASTLGMGRRIMAERRSPRTGRSRPALGSRASEGQRAKSQQCRRLTPRVRPCPGAAGGTRVLRVGVEAAIAGSSMRSRP